METRAICILELILVLLFSSFVSTLASISDQSSSVCLAKQIFDVYDTMQSFVPVASGSDFPIHNLPYGVFSTPDQV